MLETKDRIIEAARKLFWEQGYSATGIAQILKQAEANSGSLYHFFPTKEDLLIAVLEKYKEMLCPEVINPVFERVTDPIERIFGILDGYRKLLEMTGCNYGCPIGNLALEVGTSHPRARQLLAENFTGWRAEIEKCIADAGGRLPNDLDPKALSALVLILMEGAVMLARTYQSIEPYDHAVTQLRDYFERLRADGTTWSRPRAAELPIPDEVRPCSTS